MLIIKLDATDSTNAYLKNLLLHDSPEDFTVVLAHRQFAGRGQMGTHWLSEAGKNLTFSILKKHDALSAQRQFSMTVATSLGVYRALKRLRVPELKIKWPNDILSGSCKICGILIENLTAGRTIQSSILGIGLNVNQESFEGLEQVSSLKLLLGRPLDLEEVLHLVLEEVATAFDQLQTKGYAELKATYVDSLFRKDKPSTFRNGKGELFMGFIRGVTEEGRLLVALEDDVLREFDLKEIQLLY